MSAQGGAGAWRSPAAVGFASGALFASGLTLSGMSEPSNVLGFLDFTGEWNPKLLFVMAGAVLTHFAWLRLSGASAARLVGPGRVDRLLLVGAVVFGVGWGMSGYCPGPALVALAFGRVEAIVFVAAMLLGTLLASALRRGALDVTARDVASAPDQT